MSESENTQAESAASRSGGFNPKKFVFFLLKLGFSVAMVYVIYTKMIGRDGAAGIGERLASLSWEWIAAAIGMQLCAIVCATVRWQRLLTGQGIHATWRFLGGSIMIARFWGAFTPGGFTGFGGWRIFDVAQHTKKVARATATIGVEMILGQLAMGMVAMLSASYFGYRFIGKSGVLVVIAAFTAIIAVGLTVLAKPGIFRNLAERFLPASIATRVQSLLDAVTAYEGKGRLLAQAALFGVGVHGFNSLIYVCSSRALGIDLPVGLVFFAATLNILATIVPISINGVGLRAGAALALYSAVGVSALDAVLIAWVGFACEMVVSICGGPLFVLRRAGYKPEIRIDDPEREEARAAAIETVPRELWPSIPRGAVVGLAAGLTAGFIIGLAEALVIQKSGGGGASRVLWYGPLAYGLFCGALGMGGAAVLALSGRILKRPAFPEWAAYGHLAAATVAVFALALGAFRIRRDVFDEQLVWKSPDGIGVLLAVAAAAFVLYVVLALVLSLLAKQKPLSLGLKWWAPIPLFGAAVAALFATTSGGDASGSYQPVATPTQGAGGDVLLIVVDTLRADHLPSYGYDAISTPNLDAFTSDSVRFDQAFSNASWTRPSFASILTGRYPDNHGVMAKDDALAPELHTMAESFKEAGFHTAGLVTNFNVGPYFGFDQGFDHYQFLEPQFVLGADDSAAKLLLMQFVRQRIEKFRAMRGDVAPGTAYQDAETVNRALMPMLDAAKESQSFIFAGYMDPHDPYFPHPYDGSGYARAAHQHPDPSEAAELMGLYDGEIEYWDEHFGNLIEAIKERGLYDDMTIIITADHGEEFGDHGGFWHGTTLYDEQVRVPLIVKLPQGRLAGTTVRHWVQSVDILPTLMQELSLEVPEGVQGGSLFEGTDSVYAWEDHEGNSLHSLRERRGTDEIKLITANPGNPRGLESVELFRVDLDPGEQQNLAAGQRELVESTTESLIAAERAAHEGAVEGADVQMDEDAAARLRAIGYAAD